MTLPASARRALIALAIAMPVCSLVSVAGAAWWVRGHGGVAASIAGLAREAASLAGRVGDVPAALAVARADGRDESLAALDRLPALPDGAGGTWVNLSGDDAGDGLSFALVEPGAGGGFSFVVDGASRSGGLARLRRSADGPALWFSQAGSEYVVTDPETVRRAREICAPLRAIGAEMGRVGAQQGAIGARLGRYGGRLGALGGRLGAASARLASARLSEAARERIETEMDEVRAEMDRLSAEMEDLDRHGTAGRDELERRMNDLSKRHEAALAKVRAQLRSLVDEAIRSGKAQSLGRSI